MMRSSGGTYAFSLVNWQLSPLSRLGAPKIDRRCFGRGPPVFSALAADCVCGSPGHFLACADTIHIPDRKVTFTSFKLARQGGRGRMSEDTARNMREIVDGVYRSDSRRVFATLIRLLGDFDLAEEALHEAFSAALEQWPRDGVPANPRAWLVSAGRFKAIDGMRRQRAVRRARRRRRASRQPRRRGRRARTARSIEDDRLRLIFTCCHPALPPRRAGGAHAARGLRPHHGRDRARLPDRRAHARAAHRARQGQDSRRDAFPTRCRRRTSCRSGWTACCA